MSTQATILPTVVPRAWRDFHWPALKHMTRMFRVRRAILRAERELHALNDRTLKDMGLTRSEIHCAVRERLKASRTPLLPF